MSDRRDNSDNILVDYYRGAYGPTIRIDVQTREKLIQIKKVFLKLAESQGQADLADVESTLITGFERIILESLPVYENRPKKLEFETRDDGRIVCRWSLDCTGWRRCVGLIDGLLTYNSPSHQYLTKEGIDDAVVELAFMETREGNTNTG
jgi:hypothetical protein